MLINVFVCVEEPATRGALQMLLGAQGGDVRLLGAADNLAEMRQMLGMAVPDLVFVGASLLPELAHGMPREAYQLVVTTHDPQGLAPLQIPHIGCISLPIAPAKLEAVLDRYRDMGRKRLMALEVPPQAGMASAAIRHKIFIPSHEGFTLVGHEEVVLCASEGNYTWVFLQNGDKILSCRTLKEYEGILEQMDCFFRCHRSYIINLNHVRKYFKHEGGRIQMCNDLWAELSGKKREEFLSLVAPNYRLSWHG